MAKSAAVTLAWATNYAAELCVDVVNHAEQAGTREALDAASNVVDVCLRGVPLARQITTSLALAADSWNEADRGRVGCAVADATEALQDVARVMTAEGYNVPPELTRALALTGAGSGLACVRGL